MTVSTNPTIVVVECPRCHGTGTASTGRGLAIEVFACPTCSEKGFCEARLWTEEDQRRKIQEAEKRAAKEARRNAARERERELTNPRTHWRRTPMPFGWAVRHSLKYGVVPVRGNVRVVDVSYSGKDPRYRVQVLNTEARAWESHRNPNGRLFYTRNLPKAFTVAESLYVPTPAEAAEAEDEASLVALIGEHAEALKAMPHPSTRHREKTLYDWVTWMRENHPRSRDKVRSKIRSALNLAPPNPLDAP